MNKFEAVIRHLTAAAATDKTVAEVFSELREITGPAGEPQLHFVSDGLYLGDAAAVEFNGYASLGEALMDVFEARLGACEDDLFSDFWNEDSTVSVNVAVRDGVRYYDLRSNGLDCKLSEAVDINNWFDADWEYVERDGVFTERAPQEVDV